MWTVDGSHFFLVLVSGATVQPAHLFGLNQTDNQLVCITQMATSHAHMDPQDKAMNMNLI